MALFGAALYAAFDIVYIVVVPSVTKRYWQMIWHHIATLVMAYIALASDTECMTPCPLLVELNTLILTTQKVYKIKVTTNALRNLKGLLRFALRIFLFFA